MLRHASEQCHWIQLCWFCRLAIRVHTVRKISIFQLLTIYIQQMLACLMYMNSHVSQHPLNMKRCFRAQQLQLCISALAPYIMYIQASCETTHHHLSHCCLTEHKIHWDIHQTVRPIQLLLENPWFYIKLCRVNSKDSKNVLPEGT